MLEQLPARVLASFVEAPQQDGSSQCPDVLGAGLASNQQEDFQKHGLRTQNIFTGVHFQITAIVTNLTSHININAAR